MDTMLQTVETAIIIEPELDVVVSTAQADDPTIENQLAEEISDLWSSHLRLSADRKLTGKELRQLRVALAERLAAMKSILCHPGRLGAWRSWLLERHIPRSTADRLASRHLEALGTQTENVLTSATSEPTAPEILKFADGLLPRIWKFLTSYDSVLIFLGAIASETGVKYEWRQEGLMIFQPDKEDGATEDEATAGDDEGDSGEMN
jgi:hypothetical protein